MSCDRCASVVCIWLACAQHDMCVYVMRSGKSYRSFKGFFNIENKVLNKGDFIQCIDDLETWFWGGNRDA